VHPKFQAAVDSAQLEAEKVFNDNPVHDFDKQKIRYGRDLEINLSGDGNIVSNEILNKRPVEGPKLGGETPKSSSPLHASSGTESWGKPNRR
jgi:hypothetical protein